MSSVLIVGGSGFVGSNLVRHFSRRHEVTFTYCRSRDLSRSSPQAPRQLDVRDAVAVERTLEDVAPQFVVNAAGVKDVRACERQPAWAHAINADGTRNLARASHRVGAWLVVLSTDLVFACDRGSYREDDMPNPSTAYGRSKLAGEEAARSELQSLSICRSGGIYGRGSPLLTWLAGELEHGRKVEAYTDVRNTPTSCIDLATMLEAVVQRRLPGALHTVGPEAVNRHELFTAFARTFGFDPGLVVATQAGERRGELLLQSDASLASELTALSLGVNRDCVVAGMERLRAEGGWR